MQAILTLPWLRYHSGSARAPGPSTGISMAGSIRKTSRPARFHPCHALAGVLAALALSGCADLLPKSHAEVTSNWRSFEEARATVDRIVPYRSTPADLKAMGIDPLATANVQILTYSDILLRFPLSGAGALERLDRGLRECLEAGKGCQGFSIAAKDIRRDRTGNFWLDALQFERIVDVTGWTFNALVLVVDGRVVYVTHGGQPLVREQETTRQPLGPLQGWGDLLPGTIR